MIEVKRYGEVRGQTASREQLLAQLLEAALSHIRHGRSALEQGLRQEGATRLTKATEIVRYLMATLDSRVAPDLTRNIAAVYTFVCSRLLIATVKHDAPAASEAERAFTPIADGFLKAIEKEAGATP
jgi:flagellar protein FliS